MRESKYTSYDALPLTLTAPEVGEVLGISRAAAYELVRFERIPQHENRHTDSCSKGQVPCVDRCADGGGRLKSIRHPQESSSVCPTASSMCRWMPPSSSCMRIWFAALAVKVTAGPRTRKSFRIPASKSLLSRKQSRF